MRLKPTGPRVLLRPIWPAVLPDQIVEANPDPPTTGEVISVGKARCPQCDDPIATDLQPGMRVTFLPGAWFEDVTLDGEHFWLMYIRDCVVAQVPEVATA